MPGPTAAQRRRQAELIKALSQTGWALPGTFTERYNRCGKANCRCKQDPPSLHGPYYQWTRKVDGKTVTRLLNRDQIERYRDCPWCGATAATVDPTGLEPVDEVRMVRPDNPPGPGSVTLHALACGWLTARSVLPLVRGVQDGRADLPTYVLTRAAAVAGIVARRPDVTVPEILSEVDAWESWLPGPASPQRKPGPCVLPALSRLAPSAALPLSNVYGAGQRSQGGLGVVAHWLDAAAADRPLVMIGDPSVRRDYVHVDDVVDAILRLVAWRHSPHQALGCEGIVLNIGAGIPTSLAQLLDVVQTVVGRRLMVTHSAARHFDRADVWLDVTAAEAILGWRPATDLFSGVRRLWKSQRDRQQRPTGPWEAGT